MCCVGDLLLDSIGYHRSYLTLRCRLRAGRATSSGTDDPETPGNKQWEINFGWLGERSAGEGSYSVPDVDLNYGLGDSIQLKFELPIVIHEVRSTSQ